MCPFSWIGPLPSKIPSCAPVRYISYKVIHTCHTYMTLEKKGSSNVEHFFKLRDLEWEGARLESLFSVRGRRFPTSNLRARKSRPRISSPCEMVHCQVCCSNSARLIGRCAHGSVIARGRSSARTASFPVCGRGIS